MSAQEHSKNPMRYLLFHESLNFTCCLNWFIYLSTTPICLYWIFYVTTYLHLASILLINIHACISMFKFQHLLECLYAYLSMLKFLQFTFLYLLMLIAKVPVRCNGVQYVYEPNIASSLDASFQRGSQVRVKYEIRRT